MVALIAAGALAGADAAAAVDRCKLPRGATVATASSYTRVYRTPERASERTGIRPVYACNRRTGRRFRLDVVGRETSVGLFQVAGSHLAYRLLHFGGETLTWELFTLDLAQAKKVVIDRWIEAFEESPGDHHLVRSGAIAWTGVKGSGMRGEVWLRGADGRQLLDSGSPELIETFAVSLDRTRVFWTSDGGEPRSAPVR